MNLAILLPILVEVVLLPCAAVLTIAVVNYIHTRAERISEATNNELVKKYISLLEQTIAICVIATNQTYVDSLKAQGKFDEEAQKVALQKTKDAVMEILTEEAKIYLSEVYEDLDVYINNQIETTVHFQKQNFFRERDTMMDGMNEGRNQDVEYDLYEN